MSASGSLDFCSLCTEHDDSCHCCPCAACGEAASLEHLDPEHYDEERDEVLCTRCHAERVAAQAIHQAHLDRQRARLEQQGWTFDVSWFPTAERWNVRASHWRGPLENFTRDGRDDAMAQALQWAVCQDVPAGEWMEVAS